MFSYTSGRFLFNESTRLEERHVEFDVDELQAAAQRAVGREHGSVAHMSKLAEGGFNRVFLLEMEDGLEIIEKIPYRIAGPAFYATASEAATLTFLRGKGIPVPKVYAYCANADNPVRTEYILLEKVSGVPAADRWFDLTDKQIRRLAVSLVELEGKLFALPFGAIGSLYYKSDIPHNQQAPLYACDTKSDDAQIFCIGPIADYMFWYGRRASLDLDRGPWTDPMQYLRAIAHKEITSTEKYVKPIEPDFPHRVLGFGVQQPADYIRTLEDYLTLTPHLLPQESSHSFNRPTIRHPDLSPANFFIDPTTDKVASLIDWQHTIIQPLAIAAGCPPAFENPGIGQPLSEPELPDDLDTLPEEVQSQILGLYRQQQLFFCYRVLASRFNKPHHTALLDRILLIRKLVVEYAGQQWTGNNYTLRGGIIRAVQHWHLLPDAKDKPCPFEFSEAELERFNAREKEWIESNMLMEHYRERACHASEQGWVRNEDFERAQKELRKLKDELWQSCEGDAEDERMLIAGWPWRDDDEDD